VKRSEGGVRLWPALLVLTVAAVVLLWNWGFLDPGHRQRQVTTTLVTGALAGLLLLIWWVFYSRLALAVRLAGVVLLGVATFSLCSRYEFRGFSGDLVPRIVPRQAAELPALPAPGASASQPEAPAADPDPAPETPEGAQGETAEPATADVVAVPASAPMAAAGGDAAAAPEASPPPAVASPSFPQFLGPSRDARLADPGLVRDWNAEPPRELWRQPIGLGWAGFAVAGGLAVTQEQRGSQEAVVAYDLEDGTPRWSHIRETAFESPLAGDGPRATPSIAGGSVYALGGTGLLAALDLQTGALQYERDVLADAGARIPSHGVAASPLVMGELLVVLAGGPAGQSLIALDRATGERRWSGGSDPAAYSSPLLATFGGVSQIVVLNQIHVAGHDARSGEVLWSHPWPKTSERVAQPVPLAGDRLFVSTGYGIGGQMLHVRRGGDGAFAVELLYATRRLKAKFTQMVEHQGFLYGLDDGVLVCLDPETGERRWKQGRYGHGQVLLVGELLLLQAEEGYVVLIDPGPQALVELGRFEAVSGRAWAQPTLAGDLLLVRGEAEVACFRLPTAADAPQVTP
jgi:outer membrane protein assembly factor BamB